MKRNLFLTRALIGLLVVMMVPFGAFGQDAGAPGTFGPQELDQMLAPIALYPDSLLAQVLIAATYPDQVTEADRWMKANPNLKGDALNDALDKMTWDLSVKALAPFPQVLDMMAKESAWTQRLGEAFLAQQADVMDAVQKLRQKAEAAGNLKTTEQQKVVVQGEAIEIEPANPEVVYVPRYDPVVVYGPWWYPAYPPLVYSPCCWPGVAVGVGVFGFWGAVAVGPVWGWGWGSWGWGGHNVNINVNRNININRNVNINRSAMRTTSLHQAAAAGRIGSGRAAAAARAGGAAGAGAGAGQAREEPVQVLEADPPQLPSSRDLRAAEPEAEPAARQVGQQHAAAAQVRVVPVAQQRVAAVDRVPAQQVAEPVAQQRVAAVDRVPVAEPVAQQRVAPVDRVPVAQQLAAARVRVVPVARRRVAAELAQAVALLVAAAPLVVVAAVKAAAARKNNVVSEIVPIRFLLT